MGFEEEGEGTEREREEVIKILVGAPDDQLMQRRHRRHLRLSRGDLLWGAI